MGSMVDESVSNDSTEDYYTASEQAIPKLFPLAEAVDGVPLIESLEKFITLCRTRLTDPPNRRKKRYSGLRKTILRYNHSFYWNALVFHHMLTKFHKRMESEGTDHEKAEAIFKDLLKELTVASGHVSCSGSKCRKRKKKSRKEPTVNKLEKSLAVIQRRITRLNESSTDAWEVRDGRDGRCLKLHQMQKKAIRLTKKITELSKLMSNTSANATSSKPENIDEASGNGGDGGGSGNSSSSGFNSNSDMDELNCLLKSVRLKESIKIKPKVIYKSASMRCRSVRASDTPRRTAYPRIEMVEIKKFDQQNQCYVEPSTSSKPMPFKIVRWKSSEANSPSCNSPSIASSPPSDVSKGQDLNDLICTNNRNRSPTKKRSELNKLRKQSTFDLICDRFRHVKLNS